MIPLDSMERILSRAPESAAVIGDSRTLTWRGYADEVRRLVPKLQTLLDGTEEPSVVAFGVNSIEYVTIASAAATLGVPLLGLDAHADRTQLVSQCAQLRPSVVVSVGCEIPAGVYGSAPVIDARRIHDVTPSEREWVRPPFRALGFTSGTTGLPKLTVRLQPSEARRTASLVDLFGFDASDVHLVTVPFFHASGHGWARTFLSLGATIVVPSEAEPGELVDLIEKHAVRTTLMVPPVFAEFVEQAERRTADLTSLRFLLTGGRHVAPCIIKRADERLGPVVHTYYGTTETGVNLIATPAQLAVDPLTSGTCLPGNSVAVVDDRLRPLPSGVTGRVALSSYMAMSDYANASAADLTLDEERYLVTADHGYLDDEGKLFIVNRDDGLPDAARVPVVRLEAELHQLSEVRDAVLLRVPSEAGSSPLLCAAVVPAPGVALNAVEAACFDALASSDEAISLRLVESIPYSRTGKVQLPQLRELIA